MQQQVNSYTYQLTQNLEKSVLQCHLTEPIFYASAKMNNKNKQNGNNSVFYRLHFDEQNPRKSQIKKQQIQGQINGIYSISKDSQDLLITLKNSEGNYCLSKTTYPLLQDESLRIQRIQQYGNKKYQLISHRQTKKHFLVGDKEIYLANEQDMKRGQKLVQTQADRYISGAILDPIHQLLTYVLDQKQIIITDKTFKKQKYALKIGTQDLSSIISIDYNPNKQYYLMSCHNQALKFWDVRKQNLPIKVYTDHHALVLNAKYNHSHDQLIACSYDDGTIGLLRMNSVSSTPGENQDTLVKIYDQHEDSVFNVKWANFSPWIFASLSYSAGNIDVNFVPSVQKYRILL